MKKVFFVIVSAVMVLSSCASYTVWYRQDGIVPFKHFQTVQSAGERLVFISPVLAPNHRQSGLYIITNPEDIQKAMDTVGEPGVLPPRVLDSVIRPFSPIIIMSSRDISTVNHLSNYDISNQDGIAVFSLPPFVDQFFYAYMIIRKDYRWGSNDPAEIQTGILLLPPGSQDVYITFSEREREMVVSANINPDAIKNAYDKTTGLYGQLLGKKDQTGFIKIGLRERVMLANNQSRARVISAGATLNVYSEYYTYQQETKHGRSARSVGNITRTYGGSTAGVPPSGGEIMTYIANIPVRQELEFEVYKGNINVFRGKTPAEITGIEVGAEYTLRWVSPVDGNRSSLFKLGLNFLGYPEQGRYYIK